MRLAAPLCFCAIALPVTAHADTLSTFALSGVTLQSGSANGTVTIDVTTGVLSASNFTYQNGSTSYLFNIADNTYNTSHDSGVNVLDKSGDLFQISVPNLSLIGYAGGPLCSSASSCGGYYGGFFPGGKINGTGSIYTTHGSLVPTPEPSGLILLGTGALTLAGAVRRRFVQA